MKRFLQIGLLIIITTLSVRAVAAQEAPVLVRVNPESLQIAIDQITAVAVEVVDVQDVYGVDITMTFDPDVLAVEDADLTLEGIQIALGDFLDPGFVIINQADNEAGVLRLAMAQLNPSMPKSGTGNLVVINFRGKQIGAESELNLASVKMARINGTSIETTTQPGVVEVVEALSGPTYTPVPTQGAGTPLPTLSPSETPLPTQRPSSTPVAASPTLTSSPTEAPPNSAQSAASPTPNHPTATMTIVTDITLTDTVTADESGTGNQVVSTDKPSASDSTPVAGNISNVEASQTTAESIGISETQKTVTETVYPIWLIALVGFIGIAIGAGSVFFLGFRRRDNEKQLPNERSNEN